MSTARIRRETSQYDVLWRTWTYYEKISLSYLNMNKALKNLTPGKVAYIWGIERFQIDAVKFERTQIHFLVMFSQPSSSLLKVPDTLPHPAQATGSRWDSQSMRERCFQWQRSQLFSHINSRSSWLGWEWGWVGVGGGGEGVTLFTAETTFFHLNEA